MFSRTLAAVLFVPALLIAQPAFEAEGRYWIPQMRSTLLVQRNGFGTDIDAKQDLGMSDTNFPLGQVSFEYGRQRLQFSYTPIDFTGDNVVTRTIVFNGRQYTLGTRIVSELQAQHLQLNWSWEFLRFHEGLVKLGPMLEADGFLLSGRLEAPAFTPPVTQNEDLSVGLPTAGLALEINPHRRVNIYGQVAGMKIGSYGYFIGSDAGVKIRAVRHVFFTAGYRTFNLHVNTSNDFSRMQLSGPFVGAGFRL